jgi:uncharacterized protein (DUF934 family)
MAKLIQGSTLATDTWLLLSPGVAITEVPASGDVIVPLALWLEARLPLAARAGRTAVWLDAHERPESLGADARELPLIAVNFPKFNDGRGFSIGRLLRERFGFRGELRAIGDVLRDQLLFLRRCGFDAFALRDDQDVDEALAAFNDFSEAYQPGLDQPIPLFRRRLAEAAR